MRAWESVADSRYDCYVVYDEDSSGYTGRLFVKDMTTGEILLDEPTGIAFAARFGPDVADVNDWQTRCLGAIDAHNKV